MPWDRIRKESPTKQTKGKQRCEQLWLHPLKLTKKNENMPSQKESSLPTINFQVLLLLVSGTVVAVFFQLKLSCMVSTSWMEVKDRVYQLCLLCVTVC